jgi:hypothetical protein
MTSQRADELLRAGGNDETAIMAAWTSWLFEQQECDLLTRPVLDAVYGTAWSYGHSAGLCEVETYFNELCDLAERVIIAARVG